MTEGNKVFLTIIAEWGERGAQVHAVRSLDVLKEIENMDHLAGCVILAHELMDAVDEVMNTCSAISQVHKITGDNDADSNSDAETASTCH